MGEDLSGENNLQIDNTQVGKAVTALQQFVTKKSEEATALIGENSDDIVLQIGFKKVTVEQKVIKIPLPVSLYKDSTDVCLFVKDLDKNNRDYAPTVEHFKQMLENQDIKNIPQIIPLKSLKLEYQPFEAKRSLSNMYDVFLADATIMRLLPSLLGKAFYGRKKFPIQVDLLKKDLKKEYKRAMGLTQCVLNGRGSTCQVAVGHVGMTHAEVVQNIDAAVKKLIQSVPGGALNIRNVHVKTRTSPSLQVYLCDGLAEDVELGEVVEEEELDDWEEVDTVMNAKLRVTDRGVEILADEDMEGEEEEEEEDDSEEDDDSEEEETEPKQKKKKEKKQTKTTEEKPTKKEKQTKTKKEKQTKTKEEKQIETKKEKKIETKKEKKIETKKEQIKKQNKIEKTDILVEIKGIAKNKAEEVTEKKRNSKKRRHSGEVKEVEVESDSEDNISEEEEEEVVAKNEKKGKKTESVQAQATFLKHAQKRAKQQAVKKPKAKKLSQH